MKLFSILFILCICLVYGHPAISQEAEIVVKDVEVQDHNEIANNNNKKEQIDESDIFIDIEEEPKLEKPDPYPHQVIMMEGTKAYGKLETEKIKIKTVYGELEVPVKDIVSLVPGLKNHPDYLRRIHQLIDELSHSNFKKREEAQKDLSAIGPEIKKLLEERLKKIDDDEFDAELKTRISNLIEEFDEMDSDGMDEGLESLIQEDRVITESFVIVGNVLTKSYKFKTKMGNLSFNLTDLKKMILQKKKEGEIISKVITVEGTNFHVKNIKNTNIMVHKGDVIQILASGEITLSPWGNNYKSTPDGNLKAGLLNGTTFKYGMLVCQVRDGPYFPVGSKARIIAPRSGKIKLGIVMFSKYTNGNYKFPGNYRVKVVVQPK